jgi:hypothetical protein
MLVITAATADRPTEPTPTIAAPTRESLGPIKSNMAKPTKGGAGINHRNSNISPSHRIGSIRIQRVKPVVQLEHEGEPDCYLSRCHRKDKNEHYLSVGLLPGGPGDHEGQSRGIQHYFNRHQHKDNIAPYQDPCSSNGKQ